MLQKGYWMKLSDKLFCTIILSFALLFSVNAYSEDLKQPTNEKSTLQISVPNKGNSNAAPIATAAPENAQAVSEPTANQPLWSLSYLLFHLTVHLIEDFIVFIIFLVLAVVGWKQYVTPENIERFIRRFIKGKLSHPGNSENVETHKAILEKNELISTINLHAEPLSKDDLYEELIKTKSIVKEWDRDLDKPLKFDYERFFDTYEASMTKKKIAAEIIKRYKKSGISGIILLPYERDSVAIPLQHIAKEVEDGLKEKGRRFFNLTVNKGTIEKEGLKDSPGFDEEDSVLIIQPVAGRDGFVFDVVRYLQKEKKADIKGVITIFDFKDYSPRAIHQAEEVLIELNLYYKYQ